MEYHFPKKVMGSQTSLIREIAEKGKKIPGFISFALGNPAAESIPVALLQECAREVFEEEPMGVLQYGPMTGDPELLRWVEDRVTVYKGAKKGGNRGLLLTGSGKGLGLVPRTLCGEGDEAFCDSFTFPNGFNSMKNVGARAVGIPGDESGMLPDELAKAAKNGRGKYVYLIPNFQNPSGRTMPLERRKEIYEVAQKYDLIIYEDDPYGDIRFAGKEVPTFKSLDEDGRVLYVGSFSKTLSAGLRVGFLYGADELIGKIAKIKSADGQDPLFNQKIIMRCLKKMDYDAHLKKISAIYKRKCNLMVEALKKCCPLDCKIVEPEGGMFVWVEMPEKVNVNALSDAAVQAGVGVVKSEAFAVDPSYTGHAFRLNFSASEDTDIVKGIEIFGHVIKEQYK